MKSKVWFGLFLLNLIVFGASYFLIERLPKREAILRSLFQDPVIETTNAGPYKKTADGIEYELTPQGYFKMNALVVSYSHSDSWINLSHKEWEDKINVKDVGVIWGYNVEKGDYDKVEYSHGDWTGYVRWKGNPDFSMKHSTNIHLLATRESAFFDDLMKSRSGDQVYFEGYLVNYRTLHKDFNRNTSLVLGDRQCEVVDLKEYRILKEGNQRARKVHRLSKYGIFIFGVISFVVFLF